MKYIQKNFRQISAFLFLFITLVLTRSSFTLYNISGEIALTRITESVFIIFIGITLIGVMLNHYTIQSLLILMLLGVIAVFNFYFTHNRTFIDLFLLILLFKDIDTIDIARIYLYASIAAFIVIVLLYLIGILKPVNVINFNTGVEKNSLGFIHPNATGLAVVTINVSYLYIYRDRIKAVYLLPVWLLNILILYITGARTSIFLLIIAYLLWYILRQFSNKLSINFMLFTESIIMLVCFVFSYGMSSSSKLEVVGSSMNKLNLLMTSRFSIGQNFIQKYGLSFLGQKVSYSSLSNLTNQTTYGVYDVLDNSYLKLLINYGILISIIYFFIILFILKKMVENGDFWAIIPILTFTVLGVMEQSMLYYWVNFSLAFVGVLFPESRIHQKENTLIN